MFQSTCKIYRYNLNPHYPFGAPQSSTKQIENYSELLTFHCVGKKLKMLPATLNKQITMINYRSLKIQEEKIKLQIQTIKNMALQQQAAKVSYKSKRDKPGPGH